MRLLLLINILVCFFISFKSLKAQYIRPIKEQKEILSKISSTNYDQDAYNFIINNQTYPESKISKGYVTWTNETNEAYTGIRKVNYNELIELTPSQLFYILKLINNPLNFTHKTEVQYMRQMVFYFTNENGVVFDIQIWYGNYPEFNVTGSPFLHGQLKKDVFKKFDTWRDALGKKYASKKEAIKIELYDKFKLRGVYNIYGTKKNYSIKDKAYGIQIFASKNLEKILSLGKKAQKIYTKNTVNIIATYKEKKHPFYKIVITNFQNKDSTIKFKHQILSKYSDAFLVNLWVDK